MRVLILDDEHYRHESFERRYRDYDVTRAYTVEQLASALAGKRYDLVSLDHDLGTDATGQDAARLLAAMVPPDRPRRVKIHSWNIPGALAMLAILGEAGIAAVHDPFTLGVGAPW